VRASTRADHQVLPHYLTHGTQHSRAVVFRLGQIIPPSTLRNLTSAELYVLMAAAFCHDTGMVLTQQDVENAEGDAGFQEYCSERQNDMLEIAALRVGATTSLPTSRFDISSRSGFDGATLRGVGPSFWHTLTLLRMSVAVTTGWSKRSRQRAKRMASMIRAR